MKAIIIQDHDAKALVDKLRLESLQMRPGPNSQNIIDRYDMPLEHYGLFVSEIHRAFHYHVVEWLQEQGARLS